jgi:hypothetical protein
VNVRVKQCGEGVLIIGKTSILTNMFEAQLNIYIYIYLLAIAAAFSLRQTSPPACFSDYIFIKE